MSQGDQALIRRLVPAHQSELQGDLLERIQEIYGRFQGLPKVPSLDSLLDSSEAGRLIQSIRRARQTLANETISAEHLPELLYEPQPDGLPRVLPPSNSPKPSPWAEIQPGVLARLTVQQGNLGNNLFEFRITPTAGKHLALAAPYRMRGGLSASVHGFLAAADVNEDTSDTGKSVAQIIGLGIQTGVADASLLIGYSIGKAAQALIILPILEDKWAPTVRPDTQVVYAGPDNPLAQLGVSHVWKAIDYPAWFTFPSIPNAARQELVDLFTQREILRSMDESAARSEESKGITYNKVMSLLQTLLDATGGLAGSPITDLTVQQVNQILKTNGVLPLVGPRPGYETDSPSDHETNDPSSPAYTGPNGEDIKSIDLRIRLLRKTYDVPPDLLNDPRHK
jgi:hypothetical protein